MKKLTFLRIIFCFLFFQSSITNSQNKITTPYGNNKKIGKFITVNGTKLYFEVYGEGEPLLIIHSCGTDIKAMEYQIDYFKTKYRVIAADSRGQGKSKLKTNSLTYDLMAEDLEALVKKLKLKSINILGWSDGGIIGLKMGIRNKVNINKIVTMGPNLRFDNTAVNDWAMKEVKEMHSENLKMAQKGDTSRNWEMELQLDNLLINYPGITHAELNKITAPVLITIGDRDIIKNQHAVEIFDNISKSQLCIVPGANHGIPRNSAKNFNEIADKFLTNSFDYSIRN